jgi:hypothetical protein
VVGAGEFAELRAELRRLLSGVTAPRLPERLPLALSLQRLDTACATAQEFGLNLYLSVADDRSTGRATPPAPPLGKPGPALER